jgi:protein-disulfide isomerase
VSVRTKNLPEQAAPRNQRNLYIIGGVVTAALVVAILFIVISANSGVGNTQRYASLTQTRTSDGAFVLGNPDAPITLIEFADFRCPACQQHKPITDQFIERYVATGQAKFEYRTIQTAGGDTTGYAYRLAECAEEQRPGAFWEAYEVLYEFGSRGPYNQDMARPFAQRLNLNLADLLECVPSARQLQTDQALAQRYGINATPGFLFRYGENEIVPYNGGRSIEDFGRIVEAAQ